MSALICAISGRPDRFTKLSIHGKRLWILNLLIPVQEFGPHLPCRLRSPTLREPSLMKAPFSTVVMTTFDIAGRRCGRARNAGEGVNIICLIGLSAYPLLHRYTGRHVPVFNMQSSLELVKLVASLFLTRRFPPSSPRPIRTPYLYR